MKSAITISLVPEARGGPFVFWDDLEAGFATAAKHGFDAVELFLPGPEAVDKDKVSALLAQYKLQLAALGTGAAGSGVGAGVNCGAGAGLPSSFASCALALAMTEWGIPASLATCNP